jgi:hypothetical protein
MAAEELTAGGGSRGVASLLFLAASMNTLDTYSTLNSSPWTSENFGADPDKARSCREYVVHAVAVSTIYAVASAVIAQSVWPVVGATIMNIYLAYLYMRALRRGAAAGSDRWATGDGSPA